MLVRTLRHPTRLATLPYAVSLLYASAALVGCTDVGGPPNDVLDPPAGGLDGVVLEPFVAGLSSPVDLAAPPGDPRVFVVEQSGRIRWVLGGSLVPEPFLDITDRVRSGGEQGLLGLAFPPDFASSGVFYVNYTGAGGTTHVSRFGLSSPNRADPATEEVLLLVDQPFPNHNGGQIAFGPDGMLYVGLGDGGGGGDPLGAGQDPTSLLGALLRIDVSGAGSYRVPPDNPFVGLAGRRPEIWATGLRNPWRFSFDPPTDRIYIADVGQNRFEEVDAVGASVPGLNYGWNVMEGMECFVSGCDRAGLTLPVYVYGSGEGCSITGGVVYRGSAVPALVGAYLFADFCQGWIRSFRLVNDQATDVQQLNLSVSSPSAFGVDAAGEVYVLSLDGSVQRFAAGS